MNIKKASLYALMTSFYLAFALYSYAALIHRLNPVDASICATQEITQAIQTDTNIFTTKCDALQ